MLKTKIPPETYEIILGSLSSLRLPSSLWAVHLHPTRKFFAAVLISNRCLGGVKVKKCVVFSKSKDSAITVDVHINNVLVNNFFTDINTITDINDVSGFISRVNDVKLCSKYNENNKTCLGTTEKSAVTCTACAQRNGTRKATASQKGLIDEGQHKKLKLEDTLNTSNKDTEDESFVRRETVLSELNSNLNVCIHCKHTFSSRHKLKKHARKHGLNRELYKCEFCKKTFAHRITREVHLIQQHENLTTLFLCDDCGKGYKTVHLLQEHRKKRKCGKKYSCGLCGETFSKEIYRMAHFKSHTEDQPEAASDNATEPREKCSLYYCSICRKPYDDYSRMKAHSRKHVLCQSRDFICDSCNKSFSTSGNLQAHKRLSEEMRALCNAFLEKTDVSS